MGTSFISTDAPNLIIETIKAADDGDGLIVRLYECERRRGPVTLRAGFSLRAAWRTNLLEENQEALAVEGNEVRLAVRPFEIVTVRLRFQDVEQRAARGSREKLLEILAKAPDVEPEEQDRL